MTSPENSQQEPRNPDKPRYTDNRKDNLRSAALNADHSVRSAVDRVRPVADRAGKQILAWLTRLWQWLAPFFGRVKERFGPRVRRVSDTVRPHVVEAKERVQSVASDGQHQQRPSRLRAMRAGVAVAGVGVVGVLIGSMATPSERPEIQDAANVASAPTQQTQETQDPQVIAKGTADSRNGEAKSAAAKAQEGMDIPANAEGIDVSNHNGSVDWGQVAASGKKFAFVLASDGTDFSSSSFDAQYHGAKDAGLITGAYHFGRPDESATEQADLLLRTTGGYQADGKTLPPVLDLEVDPSGGSCYGLSTAGMEQWINEFNGHVKENTGQDPIIYASPSFWQNCMGSSQAFSDNPLWLASYGVDHPTVPGGWNDYTFWQYSESGSVPGISGSTDLNRFQGSGEDLKALAR